MGTIFVKNYFPDFNFYNAFLDISNRLVESQSLSYKRNTVLTILCYIHDCKQHIRHVFVDILNVKVKTQYQTLNE